MASMCCDTRNYTSTPRLPRDQDIHVRAEALSFLLQLRVDVPHHVWTSLPLESFLHIICFAVQSWLLSIASTAARCRMHSHVASLSFPLVSRMSCALTTASHALPTGCLGRVCGKPPTRAPRLHRIGCRPPGSRPYQHPGMRRASLLEAPIDRVFGSFRSD